MSNNENKNEQFRGLKEIEAFLRDTSRPFVNKIALTKSKLKDVYDKISALKQEKIQQTLAMPEEAEVETDLTDVNNESEVVEEKTEQEVKEVNEVPAQQKSAQSESAKSQT